MDTKRKGNPKFIYPVPPFERQDQQVPGVGYHMKPVPDHGENTYIGKELLLACKEGKNYTENFLLSTPTSLGNHYV